MSLLTRLKDATSRFSAFETNNNTVIKNHNPLIYARKHHHILRASATLILKSYLKYK
jgi:hypothetical protein